jgi:hypothetical protein
MAFVPSAGSSAFWIWAAGFYGREKMLFHVLMNYRFHQGFTGWFRLKNTNPVCYGDDL